jgi:6-phosphogluconolactonase (cycloisomerase 2 family)
MVCILVVAACNCAPTLRYIVITPATSTISVGTTQQYTANGYYSNGSITPGLSVTWGSSASTIATITSAGVATGVAVGTTTITATAIGITATAATLNVNQLTSIAITPLNQHIQTGGTVTYDAMGTFNNGSGMPTTTSDITSQVTWNVGTATVASFSTAAPLGVATGLAAGTTTINATLDGVTSNTTNLTVGPAPVSLVITPATVTIAINNATNFTVQEKWSDGTLHAPGSAVTWSSSSATEANVISNGAAAAIAAGFAVGTPTITATEGSLTGTSAVTVVTGSTTFAYVPAISNENIWVYTVNATTAPYLTADGAPVSAPPVQPRQTLIDPRNASWMYVIGQQSFSSLYTITSGIPAYTGFNILGGAANWNFGVIDPYGRFLFELDSGDGTGTYPNGTIYAFSINQTNGTLVPVPGSPFTANLDSGRGLVVDHSGQYLYATNYGNSTISAYQIDQSTGALTPLATGATIPTGANPEIATLDPTGTYIYVANKTGLSVSSYSIGTGGALTSLGADTVLTGAVFPINVKVAPNGKYLYVVDAGNPSASPVVGGKLYGLTLTSGVPSATPITGTPIATGVAPTGLDIDPTGVLLAVANSGAGSLNIAPFTIGAGGALTAQPTVGNGNYPLFITFFNAP